MSTTRIPKAEITGLYGALVKRFSKKLLGRVPEPPGVYWHNRAVLKATMGMGTKAQKWNACDLGLKSFAHMAVSAQIGCSWCLDFAYFQASNEHLDIAGRATSLRPGCPKSDSPRPPLAERPALPHPLSRLTFRHGAMRVRARS